MFSSSAGDLAGSGFGLGDDPHEQRPTNLAFFSGALLIGNLRDESAFYFYFCFAQVCDLFCWPKISYAVDSGRSDGERADLLRKHNSERLLKPSCNGRTAGKKGPLRSKKP